MKWHYSCSGIMNIKGSFGYIKNATLGGHLAVCCYDLLLGWNHIVESKLFS